MRDRRVRQRCRGPGTGRKKSTPKPNPPAWHDGRYLLKPEIMDILRIQQPSWGGEIQFSDAISIHAAAGGVRVLKLLAHLYNCGSKRVYLEATIDIALNDPNYSEHIIRLMK